MAKAKDWTEELLVRVLPIWRGQVGYACELMETTIIGLTERFSKIVNGLQRVDQSVQHLDEVDNCADNKQSLNSALAELTAIVNDAGNEQLSQKTRELEQAMTAVLQNYETQLKFICQENTAIKNQVEELLVDLQFQDRVSQILRQVISAQGQLSDIAVESMDAREQGRDYFEFDTDKWIDGLRDTYAMEDQMQIHDGNPLRDSSKKLDEITFF